MSRADEALESTLELMERQRQAELDKIRKEAANMPAGNPGECDNCGEYKERLVDGHCGRCRDRLNGFTGGRHG